MEIHQTATTGVALKFSEGIVAVNPPEKSKGPSPTIILSTYPVPVGGWMSTHKTDSGEQCLFQNAGEYEKEGIYIRGFGGETEIQGVQVQTTAWCIDAEGIRVFILGDSMEQKDITQAMSDAGDIDVLIPFCVTTKDKRIDAVGIASVAAATQAQRIVPIGDNEALKKKLAKELGDAEEITGKYVLKKKELLEAKAKVILFL
ncbi:MAG: hypothetical protein OXB96_01735 [Candidatus Kaiserbacteria bacterium]|nr:hypothetical protein [Candidatus Kaiserbacteria bacterium]